MARGMGCPGRDGGGGLAYRFVGRASEAFVGVGPRDISVAELAQLHEAGFPIARLATSRVYEAVAPMCAVGELATGEARR